MDYLFSKSGIDKTFDEIQSKKTLYALEFDGALAPIVPFPDDASMRPQTENLLTELSQEETVLILSGRKLEDLTKRVKNIPNIPLVCNHGIEYEVKDFSEFKYYAEKLCCIWKSTLRETLKHTFSGNYIDLEDKRYSLSLHYRRIKNNAFGYEEIIRLAKKLVPSPRILPGDSVINLLPSAAPGKGAIIRHVLRERGLDKAVFVGNYPGEDFFYSALPEVANIRVGFDPNAIAQLYIRDQNEIEDLLDLFIRL